MDTLKISVRFVGRAVDQGTMDVRDLAPALVALAEMTDAASRAVNGPTSRVEVRVTQHFRPRTGSGSARGA